MQSPKSTFSILLAWKPMLFSPSHISYNFNLTLEFIILSRRGTTAHLIIRSLITCPFLFLQMKPCIATWTAEAYCSQPVSATPIHSRPWDALLQFHSQAQSQSPVDLVQFLQLDLKVSGMASCSVPGILVFLYLFWYTLLHIPRRPCTQFVFF